MFKPELIQVGDILSYKYPKTDIVGDMIGFFSNGGKYSHTSGISELQNSDGKFMIIESHIETGVVEKELNPKWYDIIDVYRYSYGLSDEQKACLIDYLRKNELGKGYDLCAFPSAFVKGVVAQCFGWKNFSKCRPILNDDAHRFCTELWEAAYWNALKIELNPGIDYHSVNPSLLTKGQVFQVC